VTQVNFAVPGNTPLGLQQVIVGVGGSNSIVAKINVTP